MKKALEILYGTSDAGDSQESQYLLHSTFCAQYSVSSDYSSLYHIGTNPLGSLSLICFPAEQELIVVSDSAAVPDSCFQNILSFLPMCDQISARAVMDVRKGASRGVGGSNSDSGRPVGGFSIDPYRLRCKILEPKAKPESNVKYINMEIADEENQYIDIIIEEPTYADIISIANDNRTAAYCSVFVCIGIVAVVIFLII